MSKPSDEKRKRLEQYIKGAINIDELNADETRKAALNYFGDDFDDEFESESVADAHTPVPHSVATARSSSPPAKSPPPSLSGAKGSGGDHVSESPAAEYSEDAFDDFSSDDVPDDDRWFG